MEPEERKTGAGQRLSWSSLKIGFPLHILIELVCYEPNSWISFWVEWGQEPGREQTILWLWPRGQEEGQEAEESWTIASPLVEGIDNERRAWQGGSPWDV